MGTMKKPFFKPVTTVFIVLLIFLYFTPTSSSKELPWWNERWSCRQKIEIPFDTSKEIAKHQPIDIRINFDRPRWAINENEHSIRICFWDGHTWYELESQIYDLEFKDGNLIQSCSLVFLIPENRGGEYFIYYDETEKPSPNYPDHVKIEESFYRYEPIPGYPLKSHFYKIIDDGYFTYGVSKKGQFMGYNTAQHVTKMKEKTTEIHPKNGELFAAFDFKYCYEEGLFGYSSTSQKLFTNEITIDGNLMVECRIVSRSKFDDLQTSAVYKYYHCPVASNTRIHVHVKHETLKEVEVYSKAKTDGTFASLQIGGVKSRSIAELNMGQILPFMHFYNERNAVTEYPLDIDPEYFPDDPDIRILSIQDDVDLGKNAWISFDEGETGTCHSLIFNSNNVLISGRNEKDGVQLNAFQMDYPHLPGLENNIATMQICRNSVEKGEKQDFIIPDDFTAEFDVEFFSTTAGGYKIIEEEAEIFRELVKIKPRTHGGHDQNAKESEKHDLSVIVHFGPSFPIGSTLSAFLGRDLSYICVELYKEDEFIYSGTAVRLPMTALEDFDKQIKITQVLSMFDFKNISVFKKTVFRDVEEGDYVVKIYRENPFLQKEKRFIGTAIVNLYEDEKIHVFCRPEGRIDIEVSDQNNKKVENAKILLQKDNVNIAKCYTDEKGQATIKAPISSDPYDIKVLYRGCLVYEEPIKIRFFQHFEPLKKSINLQRYTLSLEVIDTWQQPLGIEINPILIATDETNNFLGQKLADNRYIFTNLPSNTYRLNIDYKTFYLNEDIKLSGDKEIKLVFPAEFNVKLKIMDSRGTPCEGTKITITRNEKKLELQKQKAETTVSIPPGRYQIRIYNDDTLIGSRNIHIYGEQKFDIITTHQPSYPTITTIVSTPLGVIALIVSYFKKEKRYILMTLPILLLINAVFLPWWEINGSTNHIETSTKLYLVPNNMVTFTSDENTIAGELSYLPDEFVSAINLIVLITIGSCVLTVANQFFKNKKRQQISKTLTVFLLIGSLSIFIFAMNELCKVSVGSFIGEGYIETSVPGESNIYSISCNWGPSAGLYIYIVSILILSITFFMNKIWRKSDAYRKR
jgi:hypothetical protein